MSMCSRSLRPQQPLFLSSRYTQPSTAALGHQQPLSLSRSLSRIRSSRPTPVAPLSLTLALTLRLRSPSNPPVLDVAIQPLPSRKRPETVLLGLSGVVLVMLSVLESVCFFWCNWSKINPHHQGSYSFSCFSCIGQRKPGSLARYIKGYFNNISEYLRIRPPLYFVVKKYNYSLESRQMNQLCSISQCDSIYRF